MAQFASFICIFLVSIAPHTCQAQTLVIGQVYRLMSEIDTMVQRANVEAATYLTELQGLFDNLNTSVSTNLSRLSSDVNDLVTTVQLQVASLVTGANDTDVSECTNLATTVISKATEIQETTTSCVSREVDQAEEELELTVRYVNSQLSTLGSYESFAHHCIARLNESEQTISDATQAFACVQPLHRSTQLFMLRFGFIIDIELAKDLFSGFETRVATCISIGTKELETLTSTLQSVLKEIAACNADVINSSL